LNLHEAQHDLHDFLPQVAALPVQNLAGASFVAVKADVHETDG